MKRTIITMMAGLTFISTTIAQSADRVAAKGFAVFSANDTFHPYEFTRHAATTSGSRFSMPESVTATCKLPGMSNRNRSFMPMLRRLIRRGEMWPMEK